MARAGVPLLVRFGLAGAANTLVGFGVIAALDLGLRLDPRVANAAGYIVGLGTSFVLNRGLVFRSAASARTTGLRFVAAAGGAFVLNQLVLSTVGWILGADGPARAAAQIAGMATYSLALFLACRVWVFADTDFAGRTAHEGRA